MNIINLDKIKIRISEKLLQKLILDLLGFAMTCWIIPWDSALEDQGFEVNARKEP